VHPSGGGKYSGVDRRREPEISEPEVREAEDRLHHIEEVFLDFHPGDTLKGAGLPYELTQAQLAAMIGVKPGHISEMEKGKRPIGKEMPRHG
jgi:predicted transcriptional regulator